MCLLKKYTNYTRDTKYNISIFLKTHHDIWRPVTNFISIIKDKSAPYFIYSCTYEINFFFICITIY
jgi:hypothetical protein